MAVATSRSCWLRWVGGWDLCLGRVVVKVLGVGDRTGNIGVHGCLQELYGSGHFK